MAKSFGMLVLACFIFAGAAAAVRAEAPPASTPTAAPAAKANVAEKVAALWLRGKVSCHFDDAAPGEDSESDFEILLDGGERYYSYDWAGKAGVDEHGFWEAKVILPYWEGVMGHSWGQMGGRGGGNYGYNDARHSTAPARRIWPFGGQPGAAKDQLVYDRKYLREEFADLKDHEGLLIPHTIIWREKGLLPPRTFTYHVTEVQFLPVTQAQAIMNLRKKYFGDTRVKDSTYPDGSKQEEHIYEGDLPVLDLNWSQDGKLEKVFVYTSGFRTASVEWFPDGKKKSQTHTGDGTYAWTAWGPDGAVLSEGQHVYADDGTRTGWSASYYPGGKKQEVRHERQNRLDGPFQSWDEKGKSVDDGVYKDGKPWSGTFLWIISGEHGNNGASDGKTHYYKDGKQVPRPEAAASGSK